MVHFIIGFLLGSFIGMGVVCYINVRRYDE